MTTVHQPQFHRQLPHRNDNPVALRTVPHCDEDTMTNSICHLCKLLSWVQKVGRSGREHFTTRRSHRNGDTYESEGGAAPDRCLWPVPYMRPPHHGETLSEFLTCVCMCVCVCARACVHVSRFLYLSRAFVCISRFLYMSLFVFIFSVFVFLHLSLTLFLPLSPPQSRETYRESKKYARTYET